MEIVTDLLDAYTQHIFLSISIMDEEGDVVYTSNAISEMIIENIKHDNLLQMARVLDRPTLSSIYNEKLKQEIFYFISPFFSFEGGKSFLVAGPFQKPSTVNSLSNYKFPILDDSLITDILHKFSNLYYIIHTKQNFENNKTSSTEWLTVMHQISHNYFEHLNDGEEIYRYLVNQLMRIRTIHFSAIALKNSEGVYEVKHGVGEGIEKILHKTFYLGEGLLGNAIIHNKSFLWDVLDEQPHLEFFQRNNFSPQQLFGVPIYDQDNKIGLLFGGNYISQTLKLEEIEFLADVMKIASSWSSLNRQLQQVSPYKKLFTSWLSLLGNWNNNNYKETVKDLFLIFEMFDPTIECLATLPQNRLSWKTPPKSNHLMKHSEAFLNKKVLPFSFKEELHYFYLNLGDYGFFTFYFPVLLKEDDSLLWIHSLVGITTLLKQTNDSGRYKRLYEILQELDSKKYEQVKTALAFVEEIHQKIQFDEESYELIRNCCMILPYSMSYLKNNIGHSREYTILQTLFELNETVSDCVSLMVAFLNKQIFNQHPLCATLVYEQNKFSDFQEILRTCFERTTNLKIEDELNTPRFSSQAVEQLPITKREKEVFRLLVDGYNNSEISSALNISTHTVKNHLTNIFKKLNVSDRVQAMAQFYKMFEAEIKT